MNNAATIFEEARGLTGSARDEYLARACAGDASLRAKVELLLAAAPTADAFFGETLREETVGDSTPVSESPGATIGRYKLLQEIGEGGFGVVYMAEQIEPVTRRVALKIIKLGMDTRQVIARFLPCHPTRPRRTHAQVIDIGIAKATNHPDIEYA